MCFDAQYTRSLCRNSIQALQVLVNPTAPVEILRNGITKPSNMMALRDRAPSLRAPPPPLQLQDQNADDDTMEKTANTSIVTFAATPGASPGGGASPGAADTFDEVGLNPQIDKQKIIKKQAEKMNKSGHATRATFKSKSFAVDRASSEDTMTRMRAQGITWKGLYGTLELTIMSGGMLNIADGSNQAQAAAQENVVAKKGRGAKATVIVAPKVYQPSPFVAAVLHSQPMPRPPEVWKTQVTRRSANPIWNERRTFTIQYDANDVPPQDVRLEVWDYCDTGAHTFMGESVVPFPWEPGTQQFHTDLMSNPAKMKDKFHQASGTLSFQLRWKEEDMPAIVSERIIQEPEFHRTICGTLAIECSRCINLRKSDLLASDPYCIIHVCASPGQVKSWRSSTHFGTTSPVVGNIRMSRELA
jgi:hypothetical protein